MKMVTCKFAQNEVAHQRLRVGSKKSVQQGHSHFYARSVHLVREHGKMARTPLAAFFNRPLRLSRQDRDLILEHAGLDENIIRPLRVARVDAAELVMLYTLDDLDELSGAVAAEANHAKAGKLQRQLQAVWSRITDTLRSYDDGLFDDSLPR